MSSPLSTHLPQVSGGIVTVPAASGTLIVDTGLRNLQTFVCTLAEDADAAVAGVTWETVAQTDGTKKVTIKTWEDDGTTAGSGAHLVSWFALGK